MWKLLSKPLIARFLLYIKKNIKKIITILIFIMLESYRVMLNDNIQKICEGNYKNTENSKQIIILKYVWIFILHSNIILIIKWNTIIL